MASALWVLPLLAVASGLPDDGDIAKGQGKAAVRAAAKAANPPEFSYDRESAARAFVARNHPELNALLERLKAMSPVEYEKTIVELSQVDEALAVLKNRDPNRYGPSLEAWKAKSRVDVLAAQYALKPNAELESSLRQAIAVQIDCDLALRKLDRDAIEARLRKADEQIGRMESQRDSAVENRLNALRKKAPKAKAAARTGKAEPPILASPEKPSSPAQKGKP
ncbi:MAG: hypothetical protein U0800_21985 [Isosphaeraceae bacterium]